MMFPVLILRATDMCLDSLCPCTRYVPFSHASGLQGAASRSLAGLRLQSIAISLVYIAVFSRLDGLRQTDFSLTRLRVHRITSSTSLLIYQRLSGSWNSSCTRAAWAQYTDAELSAYPENSLRVRRPVGNASLPKANVLKSN